MNLYDFCSAVARNADRRVGIHVCRAVVEEHRLVLNRVGSEEEFRAAFHRMLQTFAPHDEVAFLRIPFSIRAMARFLVYALAGGRIPARETWQTQPVLQNHLSAAMRFLLSGLTTDAASLPRAPNRNEGFLTAEDDACLQWGNITSDAAYVMALAERLRPLPVSDRQTILEMIRADMVDLPEVSLADFTQRLRTYTTVPAAKA